MPKNSFTRFYQIKAIVTVTDADGESANQVSVKKDAVSANSLKDVLQKAAELIQVQVPLGGKWEECNIQIRSMERARTHHDLKKGKQGGSGGS